MNGKHWRNMADCAFWYKASVGWLSVIGHHTQGQTSIRLVSWQLDADPSPPSSAVGHERVELFLYSPYGPYGLYKASVPVQGCTLPLLYLSNIMNLSPSFQLSTYSSTYTRTVNVTFVLYKPLHFHVTGRYNKDPELKDIKHFSHFICSYYLLSRCY